MLENKNILITGGTGSFGETLVRYLLQNNAKEIRVFSRDEKKQEDLRHQLNQDKVKFYIGDVREYESLKDAATGVDYVFHAAALKQVPSCEFYPIEAIKTNVLGTENVLKASIDCAVEKVVVLSTDKAVYPINAMGQTKALAEKIVNAKARLLTDMKKPVMCTTRYGNVMASRGSIIPLIIHQIKTQQDITITNPHMTRFLMSLDDSVDLVLFAFENAMPEDIFVQKSPACTIGNLAQALLELFNAKNPIRIMGTRHGEKLHETLVSQEEMSRAEDMGDYFRIPLDGRGLNYKQYVNEGDELISRQVDYNSFNTKLLEIDEIKSLLLKLNYVQECLDA